MLENQIKFFLNGGSVRGLVEEALLVFLTGVLQGINKKHLFLSKSDSLNRRLCQDSVWFGAGLTYYPEKERKKAVPGFMSQHNRHRSSAIIKIASNKSVCCLSTRPASKEKDINKKTKPVVFKIKAGGVVDRDLFIKEALVLGYNKTETVFKPGDLSVRGDVVDVFPVYEKEPVRINFGFDKIESVSFFNIETQRTIRSVPSYDFWDVLGKEVELGRSLSNFVVWDSTTNIVKEGGLYSVLQTNSSESISVASNYLKTLVNSKKDLLSFLVNKEPAVVYLFYTDKNKVKTISNKNINVTPGKIDKPFFVKENKSFYIPFWKKHRNTPETTREHKVLKNLSLGDMEEGALVVHLLHGVGTFGGLKTRGRVGFEKEYIKIVYAEGGVLYVPLDKLGLVHRYKNLGGKPKINKLGKKDWGKNVSKTKKEIEVISDSLVELHNSKNKPRGFVYKKDKDLERAIKKSFPYKETKDQKRTIKEVLADLKRKKPMDRLVCGDVGFGKTEVALRAIVRVVSFGKQVFFLCPTTVLSDQHYISTTERLKPLGVNVSLLSRFQSRAEQKKVITKLLKRKVDVVIGTHRLLSDDVVCPGLGLLIIDEEHRFGVKQKESIRNIRPGVDVLSLSATPIPRTLQQSILGIRNISRIETPPITRRPINTYVEFFSWSRTAEIIKEETLRGGQVYFLHNDILSIDYYTKKIQELVPDSVVKNIHGQQKSKSLERTLLDFFSGSISVLVCSTIIESGLDVTNANCIIINNPQNLGLSQLYQIRGRVGRGSRQAFCYLFVPKKTKLSETAFRRLKTIERHTSLGSGYSIASSDLDIRGAGLVFGFKQSGVVSHVGLEYYNAMLKSEINKKLNKRKEKEAPTLVYWGKSLIPIYYVSSSTERFSFYTKINKAKRKKDFIGIKDELKDRYGQIPKETLVFIDLAALALFYKGSLVSNIFINENSLVFSVPRGVGSGADQLISKILSYESTFVTDKKFREEKGFVSIRFFTTLGYDWNKELINCNSLFYKS